MEMLRLSETVNIEVTRWTRDGDEHDEYVHSDKGIHTAEVFTFSPNRSSNSHSHCSPEKMLEIMNEVCHGVYCFPPVHSYSD